MNKCLLPLIFGGFLWLGSVSVGMCEAIRIAVVGDAALSPLVALTESELSKAPDLAVLNREDLGAAGREAETSAIFASPEPARLQLLPADGLVVLRSLGKSGVLARLVAIKPAVVLHEFLLPGEADPSAQAEAVRKGFSGWLPKVAMAREDTLEGLSLPGLRSEVDAPGARELERRVNLLLASRLAASSGVVVLERWRLDDAVFEKSISPAEPTPFWQGRALLDGSVRNRDGLVRVSLRIRSSHGEETTISDQDTPENLPGLIERLAGKVVRRPLPSGGWNLQKEASHYAGLAEWCLNNRLYDDGTQAVETAIALGDVSRATQVLRIKAYAMKAYPDDLRVANTNYLRSVLDLSRESLRERLEACARAADLTCGYIEARRDFSEGKWDLKNPADLGPPVVNNCLRALKAAFENGNPEDYAAPLTEARHAVRKLITLLTAYLPGKSESGAHYLLRYKIRYASFWHETPVATLEFYQRVLEAPTEDGVRDELFSTVRTPRLDEGGTPVFVSALARPGAPWLVEWKGESATQLQAAWRKFVQDYGNSPDPVARADALKFEYFSTHSTRAATRYSRKSSSSCKKTPTRSKVRKELPLWMDLAGVINGPASARIKTPPSSVKSSPFTKLFFPGRCPCPPSGFSISLISPIKLNRRPRPFRVSLRRWTTTPSGRKKTPLTMGR